MLLQFGLLHIKKPHLFSLKITIPLKEEEEKRLTPFLLGKYLWHVSAF